MRTEAFLNKLQDNYYSIQLFAKEIFNTSTDSFLEKLEMNTFDMNEAEKIAEKLNLNMNEIQIFFPTYYMYRKYLDNNKDKDIFVYNGIDLDLVKQEKRGIYFQETIKVLTKNIYSRIFPVKRQSEVSSEDIGYLLFEEGEYYDDHWFYKKNRWFKSFFNPKENIPIPYKELWDYMYKWEDNESFLNQRDEEDCSLFEDFEYTWSDVEEFYSQHKSFPPSWFEFYETVIRDYLFYIKEPVVDKTKKFFVENKVVNYLVKFEDNYFELPLSSIFLPLNHIGQGPHDIKTFKEIKEKFISAVTNELRSGTYLEVPTEHDEFKKWLVSHSILLCKEGDKTVKFMSSGWHSRDWNAYLDESAIF
ncbi:hypothetical protein QUV58_05985 [Succinatimonas hippei]|uniref:hypothetical protein n=1 Tax=Succinatimonas hippei TaxID=626938 RepID=UPI0025A3BFD6|nr:hypothetical protein [Succinatimonas hippei]MDM8120362.1 hypothetical protein [Succinatimonas hippei]